MNNTVGVVTATFTLILFVNTNVYGWHLNLGIDDNKAAELYQTNPNEPAIFQWKHSLQSTINQMDRCFYIGTAISCKNLMYSIMSECALHPNELLACNDTRLAEFPALLKLAQEEQDKRQKQEAISKQEAANLLANYNKCIVNTLNSTMTSEDCYRNFKGNQTK